MYACMLLLSNNVTSTLLIISFFNETIMHLVLLYKFKLKYVVGKQQFSDF